MFCIGGGGRDRTADLRVMNPWDQSKNPSLYDPSTNRTLETTRLFFARLNSTLAQLSEQSSSIFLHGSLFLWKSVTTLVRGPCFPFRSLLRRLVPALFLPFPRHLQPAPLRPFADRRIVLVHLPCHVSHQAHRHIHRHGRLRHAARLPQPLPSPCASSRTT